jgi:hypothetical protein
MSEDNKFNLPVVEFDPIEHKRHLEILARGGPEADELSRDIVELVPDKQIIYMYPHVLKTI